MNDEIQKLKAEIQAKSDMLATSLKLQNQKDRLLHQALEALCDFDYTSRLLAIDEIKKHFGVEHE